MSRLDRHITLVQGKLAFEKFLTALGYSIVAFCVLLLAALLVDRFVWVATPRIVIWSALAGAVVAAIGIAMFRKPSSYQAAIFIDEKLGLKEKFSTALYARQQANSQDAFANAAIKDAEQTAENVSVHKRFPVRFPRSGYFALVAVIVVMLAWFLPRMNVFGRQPKPELAKTRTVEQVEARHEAERVMSAVSSLPKAIQAQQKVELAKQDLKRALDQNVTDATELKVTAQKAQEEAEQAKMEEMKANQAFAQDLTDKAVFNSLNPAADDHSPVADASRELAAGNYAKAADTLKSIPDKFDKMNADDQKKMADQMKDMANQLAKIAQDPAAMQKLQQQLQQQGATAAQAQQIAKAVQQATQGNPQAQQQLQQMQQQLQQQMNGGKGPTAVQKSAIAKAMQQMQSVAGSQASAQQVSAAAQQMARGMQQQAQTAQGGGQKAGSQQAGAKQGGPQQGQPKSGGQPQAGGQQQGTQQASAGQQGAAQKATGGQQAGGKQPGGNQPGGQPASGGGQSGQGQGQQQMKQAGEQMAQALDKMDATKKDAEEQVAGGNPGSDNGNDGDSGQDGQKPGGGNGPGKQGDPGNKGGQGSGGPGKGGGAPGQMQVAQFAVKQEKDPSQNIANGKILAKTFVKSDQLIGKSTIQLSAAAKAAVKDSTDDVDGENDVPKDAQKMVKDYFNTMAPTPQ